MWTNTQDANKHGIKHRKANHFQSLELPEEYPSCESKYGKTESDGNTFNPIFEDKLQG